MKMGKSRHQSKTTPFPGEQASTPTESPLEVIGRLSKDSGVDEAETHREMHNNDAELQVQLPRTEEYVQQVVDYLAIKARGMEQQQEQLRHANARENVLMASTVLSRSYPRGTEVTTGSEDSLKTAGNLMAKELTMLDGGY